MVAKLAVYRKREKWGTKTAPFAASVSYNLGVWVVFWSAVAFVVRIGGVYGVTIYTGNLSSDFQIPAFFLIDIHRVVQKVIS